MKRFLSLTLLCFAVGALVLAGCGSSKKDSGSSSDTSSTATPTKTPASSGSSGASGSAASGAIVKITMKNIEFIPGSANVKVGQKVEWTNNDGVPHTVTAPDAGIDSGTVNPGSKFEFTVKKAGTINYICTIHSGQKGTLKVTA